MSLAARLGILGGTLDPVHVGHIETALAARRALALDSILLLPSRVPPHRPLRPSASPFHRFAMAALAVSGVEGIEVSDAELEVPGTSYTAETLGRLHQSGLEPSQLFFILGADAFAEIDTWHRYPRVLEAANFVVVSRPGHDSRAVADRLPELAARFAPAAHALEEIVTPTRIFLIPAATPDVSSTDIRRRLRASEPITGLVADLVERHIRRHRLYMDVQSATLIHSAADHLHGQH